MSQIHVPIDYSDLKRVLPTNAEIIYSTICRIYYVIDYPLTVGFQSHVLFTPEGIAYFCLPDPKDKELLVPTYNTYLNFKKVSNEEFTFLHTDYSIPSSIPYHFKLIINSNFESNAKFVNRRMKFKSFIYPYIISTHQAMLNYVQENKNKEEKETPPLWRVNSKMLVSGEDKLFNDLLSDFIESKINEGVDKVYYREFFNLANIGYLKRELSKKKEFKKTSLIIRRGPVPMSIFSIQYERFLLSALRSHKHQLEKAKKKYEKWKEKQLKIFIPER